MALVFALDILLVRPGDLFSVRSSLRVKMKWVSDGKSEGSQGGRAKGCSKGNDSRSISAVG